MSDKIIELYDSIVSDLHADISRRLDIEMINSKDTMSALSAANTFFSRELAALKAQILDLELRAAPEADVVQWSLALPVASIGTPYPPNLFFGQGDAITANAPLYTFGMHPVESSGTGFFRWAGLMALFGLVAPIQRVDEMQGLAIFATQIDPSVFIRDVQVDGASVPFEWRPETLSALFQIPARKADHNLMRPTVLAFEASKVVKVSEVNPSSTDNRKLSFALDRIEFRTPDRAI